MTGAEHYAEAERLIDRDDIEVWSAEELAARIARAQVHATLALTAATAQQLADRYIGDGQHVNDWRQTWTAAS